ncbi:CHAT domain-containing protein [Tumidithrix elongata RA019]|uniref:CHAT domain-containing protein n=1 Tax=Tumidithrix elongata BACA0141 TaxID=2716417 RepID=A0AAW9Q3X1_9CYAN|nr:CHAT domain-containing protein [Tumidithrix elongata RA019]
MRSRLKLIGVNAIALSLSFCQVSTLYPLEPASAQTAQDRKAEADRLLQQGIQQYRTSQFEAALQSSQQALQIYRVIGNRQGEGHALGNLGIAYNALAMYDKAIEYQEQSLLIAREIKDRLGEGAALGNLGITYDSLSKYDKAIEYQEQRLAIVREIKDRLGEGETLGNLGKAYYYLGKYDKAIQYDLQWLAISREIKDRHGEGYALVSLGINYRELSKYNKAIEYYLQSLLIAREIKDRLGEGAALRNLGITYDSLGKYDKAIEYQEQWLAISREIKDRLGESHALVNLGDSYYYLGKYDKAIEYDLQWLAISREIKDREGEGEALNIIGFVLETQKQPDLAILYYKQSVKVTESIRKDIRKLDKDIRKSYLDAVSYRYKNLANHLLKQGRVTEALQVLDLLKIQELEDYLKNVKGNDRTAKGVELLAPERAISGQLSALSYDKIPELNRQLASQIQQLPKSEINKVPDYLQKLPKGAVLLYPLILDDRLELIFFSANTLPINRTIPIKKADLEKLVTDVRADMRDYTSLDIKNSSPKLYGVLIKPIEADLKQANATTILYAPDGILRYIPLSALYDGKQWLVEKYRVNNLIAYSLFDPDSKPQSNIRIFAGAFGGKKGENRFGANGLPATIPEVENIQTSFPNTTKLVDQDFTAQASKAKVSGNAIVHFATHAKFISGSPLDSYVLFGDGSKVTLAEINEWQLKDADLVVLSACETGVGSLGNGAEILGFGYQVQRAGAKASIASLWTVSDGGTQLLMEALYGNLQKGNTSMSTSLREAQLSMIRRSVKQGEINFNHPYYWSAFVLIGNGL